MIDDKTKTIESYNKAASSYNAEKQVHFWVDEFETYQKLITGKRVIDIGCGAGRDAVVFTNAGFDYTGVDASEGLIEEKNRWGGVARYFAFYEQNEFAQYLLDAGFEILEMSKYIEDDERKTVWLCYFVKKP